MKHALTIITILIALTATKALYAQSSFEICGTEMTRSQWQELLSLNPSHSAFFITGRFKPERKVTALPDGLTKMQIPDSYSGTVQKNAADNNIEQMIIREKTLDGDWSDFRKAVYEYSNDRLTITRNIYAKQLENWEKLGYAELTYNEAGFPVRASEEYDNGTESFGIYQYFYYSESGEIDSLILEATFFGEDLNQKVELNHITPDSIRIIYHEDISGDITNGYFVQKEGNLIEVYETEEFIERYTYYDLTLKELLKRQFDEFFFVEMYNEEFYDAEKGFIPSSRTTLKKDEGRVIEKVEEWYSTFNEEWQPEYRYAYTYENEGIVEILEGGYDSFEEEYAEDYQSVFTYQTTVANEEETHQAATYALYQNYPNPFNPETTIRFELAKAGIVTLQVYDVLGKKIATLLNGHAGKGSHAVRFDASTLPSGLYYYRIQGEDFVQTKTMTLIK